MAYSRKDYLKNLEKSLEKDGASGLYSIDEVNYVGITKDTKELYTEVFAEWLLENQGLLEGIEEHRRELKYRIPGHEQREIPNSNRQEEIIAIKLYKSRDSEKVLHAGFGRILDYQIPLKISQQDSAGKIDLLSQDGSDVLILELKKPDSKETMLRCVLEAYTYSKMVVKEKLFREYGINQTSSLIPAPLVFEGSGPLMDFERGKRPKLFELMDRLDIKPIIIPQDIV